MGNKVYFERYQNIYRFMDTIQSRPNNDKFGRDSSESGDWYGTKTWDEAMEQFSNGIPETAEKLKKSLDAFKANSNICATKSRPINYYYGHTPNIPAAIIGLPKSMRKVERTPQKVKAISLVFNQNESCEVGADTLRKAGECVLQMVYALELRGYRVTLDILAFASQNEGRAFILAINVKDWKQHLDILKLSFPVTSPAMFRRMGFRWAETMPGVEGGRVWGYGTPIVRDSDKGRKRLESAGYDLKTTYMVTIDDCKKSDFDALEVAKKLGIIL